MPRVSDMGERPETTKVKGVRGVLRGRRLRGVVELVTGWGSVRPACGSDVVQTGLFGVPTAGQYVFGSAA